MGKVRVYFALCLLVVLISACKEEQKEVAVLMYDLEDPFIEGVSEYLMAYNNTAYNITIYDCENSQIQQNKIAEKLYKEGVDLLVINPVERLSSYIFVQKSLKEDVPIIFFNREPLKEDLDAMEEVYYVGADARESGRMQADIIGDYFGEDTKNLNRNDKNGDNIIQCVILKGEQGHQDAEERTSAVVDELKKQGYEVEVLLTKIANWNENKAYRAMEEIMDDNGNEIEVLISNNDAMAIGAINYLKDNNYYTVEGDTIKYKPFIVVGVDGLDEALALIDQGYMYGTIINDSLNMAKAILELSQYIVEENEVMMTYELVDDKYIWISYKERSNN